MQFPVTIAFDSLGWGVHIHVTDGAGARVGYAPWRFSSELRLPIYRDEKLGTPIYTLQAQRTPGQLFTFLGAGDAALGHLRQVKFDKAFAISVGDEERFDVVQQSPGLHSLDWWIDTMPVINVLTGLLIRPCHLIKRRAGDAVVATLVKVRTAFDASYRLELGGDLDGRERECIMLASVTVAMQVRRLVPW